MNQWNNEELRKRQADGDVGFLRANSPVSRGRWRALLIPACVMLLGLILLYVGPLPGLGFFLFIGGIAGVLITFLMSWLGT